jgi:hypothetical protein
MRALVLLLPLLGGCSWACYYPDPNERMHGIMTDADREYQETQRAKAEPGNALAELADTWPNGGSMLIHEHPKAPD